MTPGKPIRADISSGDAAMTTVVPGRILGFIVASTDATNAGHVIFYDDPDSANGTVLCHLSVGPMAANGQPTATFFPPGGVPFSEGVYIDITGVTTGSVIIYVE